MGFHGSVQGLRTVVFFVQTFTVSFALYIFGRQAILYYSH